MSTETTNILRDYIVRDLLQGDARDVDPNTPLLEWGILDSLNLMTLISFVEDRFGVKIPDDAVTPDNVGTIASFSALIEQLTVAKTEAR